MFFRILPVIISCLLLGAHFLRAMNVWLAVGYVLIPLLLLIKKRWSMIVVQLFTYIGAVIWVDTTIRIYQKRLLLGRPWVRAVVILGVVTMFTVFAGLILRTKKIREKYPPQNMKTQS